jgi:hypothetical protein
MDRSRRFWPLVVVLVVFVIASGLWLALPRHSQPDLPHGYAERWLQGIPCTPPCWEGVTPGQTTVRDAIRIWNDNPGIQPGSVVTEEYRYVPDAGTIKWKWRDGSPGGAASYQRSTPPIVDLIYSKHSAQFGFFRRGDSALWAA